MKKTFFIFLVLFLALFVIDNVYAEEINSRAVSYMDITVKKGGTINLKPQTDSAFSNHIKVFLNMPQINGMQTRKLLSVVGPDDYEETVDAWGNDIIMLKWNKPDVGKDLCYEVSYNVQVGRIKLVGERENVPVTDNTRPDEKIMDIAYGLKKDTDMMTIFEISRWVYENVKYDLAYTKMSKPAEWVYENRKGTCDEYSNLAISLLKALDYNAWYAAGWAYSGKEWEPHAWVKVYLDDKVVAIDPTWLEYPIDSTHMEFTTIPDSNNTEYVQSEGSGYKIVWTKSEVELDINDYKTENVTELRTMVLNDKMKGNSHGVISAFLETDECYQGSLVATSCMKEDGSALLQFIDREKPISFCGSESYDFYFRTPSTESMFVKYSCPVIVSTPEGTKDMLTIEIEGTARHPELYLSLTDSVVVGDKIEVFAESSSGKTFYANFNDVSQSKETSDGKADFLFDSPSLPGEYTLIVFSDDGVLEKRNITVLSNRIMEIEKIEIPLDIEKGKNITINVTISAESTANGVVQLKFGNIEREQQFSILGNSRREYSFAVAPQKAGNTDISVTLFSDTYQDGWTGSTVVGSTEHFVSEGTKDILSMILDFFMQLGEMIENALGL